MDIEEAEMKGFLARPLTGSGTSVRLDGSISVSGPEPEPRDASEGANTGRAEGPASTKQVKEVSGA